MKSNILLFLENKENETRNLIKIYYYDYYYYYYYYYYYIITIIIITYCNWAFTR
jgi:hypothetical protein